MIDTALYYFLVYLGPVLPALLLLAHAWAEEGERAAREVSDMAKTPTPPAQLAPAPVPRSQDRSVVPAPAAASHPAAYKPSSAVDARSMATPSTARPGPAPMAGPSTEAPRARPCLQPPTQTDDPVTQLGPEYPAVALLGKHGGDRKSRSYKAENQACNDVSLKHGTAEHWKARLRRDDPALAVRVDRGELSANAAAIEKGWRKPRKSVPAESPASA